MRTLYRFLFWVTPLVVVSILSWSCHYVASANPNQEQLMPSSKVPSSSEQPSRSQAQAQAQFGFKLLRTLFETKSLHHSSQSQAPNLLISPTSVALALGMLYNGAESNTKAEIAKVLNVETFELSDLNATNQALLDTLLAQDKVKLAIANSLWINQAFSLKPEFLEVTQKVYQAEVASLDFSQPSSVATINHWVSEKTNEKITKIIDAIDPEQLLFLINAVYFKGDWATPFDAEMTKEQPFFLTQTTSKQHPFMTRFDRFSYIETEEFQAVGLPYTGDRLSFYVFLPRSNKSLEFLLQDLTAAHFERWLAQLKPKDGLVQLPRFKTEYETSLNQALQDLGLKSAFDRTRADFSGLSDRSVAVDQVKHKTFIEVNETGTEAAAVTSIGIRATSALPLDQPFEMIVNRPFLFVIRDNQTGANLFLGTINNPET